MESSHLSYINTSLIWALTGKHYMPLSYPKKWYLLFTSFFFKNIKYNVKFVCQMIKTEGRKDGGLKSAIFSIFTIDFTTSGKNRCLYHLR